MVMVIALPGRNSSLASYVRFVKVSDEKCYFFVFCFILSIRISKAQRLEQNLIMDVTGRDGGGRAEPDGRRVW